jgi:small subunit ribosomal protein S21
VENALRQFKRKVMTEDIIKDVKRHSFYLRPGERRRVKQVLAQKRARKKNRKGLDQVAPRRPLLPSSVMSAPTRQNQDSRRLLSEARAAPPLMSGTMSNSRTLTPDSST